MHKKQFWKKLYRYLALSVFFSLFLSFQNCGDIHLSALQELHSVDIVSPTITYLKPPRAAVTTFRAGFLIDMSNSMAKMPCPTSVDLVAPGTNYGPCTDPTGVDIDMNRLEVARQWLESTQALLRAQNNTDPEAFLIALQIFSGGLSSVFMDVLRQRVPRLGLYVPVAEALQQVAILKFIQSCVFKPEGSLCDAVAGTNFTWQQFQSVGLMRTSVPGLPLQALTATTSAELQRLHTLNRLTSTRFEFVFLSDGVPKPRPVHVDYTCNYIWEALDKHNCTISCAGALNLLITTGQASGLNDFCRQCIQALGTDSYTPIIPTIKATWGDYSVNEPPAILAALQPLHLLFRQQNYSAAQMRMNFVRVDAINTEYKTPASELSPEVNWLEKAKEVYSAPHRHAVLTSANPPFSLFPGLGTGEAYRLGALYAINLNARARTNTNACVDSDSDGLCDEDEPALGYDPQKNRSNQICGDGITHMMNGCITQNCNSTQDADGDGLNDCEEKTLGSLPTNFDSDRDGIPDHLEILYGFNPLTNDRSQDSNSDGVSNIMNFQSGLGPFIDYNNVNPALMTDVSTQFVGYKDSVNEYGITVRTAGYKIKVNNLLLAPTLAVSGSHAENENVVLFLGRVDNVQNVGDSYWIFLQQRISYRNTQPVIISLENMQQLPTMSSGDLP